ncbi:MAG: hypothetical protein FJ303_10225 [Planctomycetes bacterium]|nr:hypothetical protein [Planctomycetota bacterium]
MTRLRDRETGDVLVEVMKPVQFPTRSVFKNNVTAKEKGQTYRIRTLEMALVLKFAPIISLMRADEDKYQDAHDFIRIVKNNADIDVDTLAELGDLKYTGGGKEIVEMVRNVRAGRS